MGFDSRMSAVNCLLSSLYLNDAADFSDVVLRDQISNEAYVMTPKVLSVFKSIALGDEKLGHSLISVCYAVLRPSNIRFIYAFLSVSS